MSSSTRMTATPGEALKSALNEKGWTQDDLAQITGKSRRAINEIVVGKRGISPDTAVVLAGAFGTDPQHWLALNQNQQLSLTQADPAEIRQRADLYDIAPVSEMRRRHWISSTDDIDALKRELCRFFRTKSLERIPALTGATRRSNAADADLNPEQRAWCVRALQLARLIKTKPFNKSALDDAEARLRTLLGYPEETKEVSLALADFGIRFVVVEPIRGAKIDGAALWLSRTEPVIAMSLRHDRIDGFWFTLMHEFSHIRHGDASVDAFLVGDDHVPSIVKEDIEQRADDEAERSLIDRTKLESFIARVGPLYSKTRINQFANRIQVHPGLVIGQLQHRGELGYSTGRDRLEKVREFVAQSSLTDGWGQAIPVVD